MRLTVPFLREIREKRHLADAILLVDEAHHLGPALSRLGLQFQMCRRGNWDAFEHMLREVR